MWYIKYGVPGLYLSPYIQDCKRKSSNRAEDGVGPWKSFISKFYKKTSNTQKAKKVWAFCMHTFICDENWKRTVLFFRCRRRRRPARLSCSDEKRRKLFPFPRVIFFSFAGSISSNLGKDSQRQEQVENESNTYLNKKSKPSKQASRRSQPGQGVDIRLLRLRFGGAWHGTWTRVWLREMMGLFVVDPSKLLEPKFPIITHTTNTWMKASCSSRARERSPWLDSKQRERA